jgi:hypothetical protein
MKTLEDIKKELTSTLKEHEALLQAWNNVNRLYKKDGSSFSILSKNFENATIQDESYSIYPAKVVKVFICCEGKYYNEEINCTQLVRYSQRKVDESRIIHASYLEDRYNLTIDEIFEEIELKKEYHKKRIEELNKQLEMAELYYKQVLNKMEGVKTILDTLCDKSGDRKNIDLRYDLEEVVHEYYFR